MANELRLSSLSLSKQKIERFNKKWAGRIILRGWQPAAENPRTKTLGIHRGGRLTGRSFMTCYADVLSSNKWKETAFSARSSHRKWERPWACIDSDGWVKCSVSQMNPDSMFITELHTALHTHAVCKSNKQPCAHLPLSRADTDLVLSTHWVRARKSQIPKVHRLELNPSSDKNINQRLTTRFTGMKLASMETIRNWT